MRILILDLGLNNINSVLKSLVENSSSDDSIEVLSSYQKLDSPSFIVLPGLGKFEAAMQSIREKEFDRLISENIFLGGFVVGICLGMQLLMFESEESPGVKGLELIGGRVKKLPLEKGEHIPNVGWNSTKNGKSKTRFDALEQGKDFYFVHSYAVELTNDEEVLAISAYGAGTFPSAIISNKILGFQFHPEKSSHAGSKLMREVINWSKNEI